MDFRVKELPRVQHEPVYLKGGLDLVTPALQLPPGAARQSQNYYADVLGGYRRTDGYERYDGRPSPSDAVFHILPVTFSATVNVGDTVTGVTSTATGYVIAVTATQIVITKKTLTFDDSEVLNVGGSPKATTTGSATGSAATALLNAQYLNLAADAYRSDITAVTGSGNILGGFYFNNVAYAFRNNAGATAAALYKSTASGWSLVSFEYEVAFTAGSGDIDDGDTLTQGGVTATIRRVVIRTGTLAGANAAGILVISAPAGGNFAAGAATTNTAGALTLSGAEAAITLQPNGRFETVQANFGGTVNTLRVYGCDGVNRAWEFDGTYFVPIPTGMTTDAPNHVSFHRNHLFLSFLSSVQHSAIGNPFNWSPVFGASEISLGETVTAFLSVQGTENTAALVITGRNMTSVLYGSGSSSWSLITYSRDVGGIAYTLRQFSPHTFMCNFRGVTTLAATANFGNFEEDTVTRNIQTFMTGRIEKITDSTISGFRSQYRLFFSDGYVLYITMNEGKFVGSMPLVLPNAATCCFRGESSTGVERIFFGSSNGMVYEMDKGTSFDGAAIDSFLYLPYNHSKSPRMRKRYRKFMLEVSGEGYSQISISYELNYNTTEIAQPMLQTYETPFTSAQWDSFTWDSFIWDGKTLAPSEIEIRGTGENISFLFAGSSDYHKSHKLHAGVIHYSTRRGVR